MKDHYILNPSIQNPLELLRQHAGTIGKNDTPGLAQRRAAAARSFEQQGFPTRILESWKNTSLEEALNKDYVFSFLPPETPADPRSIFRCEIHNFETYLFTQLNGWNVVEQSALTTLPNGVIVGSLWEAIKQHPAIFEEHYGKYARNEFNGMIALNTAFAQDGLFIYVPDNTVVEKPIQMVNIVQTDEALFIQPRHLIVVGKNSKLTFVHCDDSTQKENTFINSVTEVFMDENSEVDHYKMQNKDAGSTVVTSLFIHQNDRSRATTHTLTFNSGVLRNDIYADLQGSGCDTQLNGLYLVDRKQHIDNQVYVNHAKPDNTSTQLYKGIIDDEASAVFNGHIFVARDAQHTEAFQTNRNILLTDTAKVTTKPFLEIYADDVKCSHGATVGQLDPDSMYYIRSRGICERNARMLLMYAFAAEVIQKVSIGILRERLDAMVQRRLKGELSICDQCVLHCKDQRAITFEIDMSKI